MDQWQYKIVVTGPYGAGKSALVRALCGDAVSIDSFGTTVVMDYGQRRYLEMDVAIFGTPGQSRSTI
ncbi:MAG: GTPase [Candidatus Thermoplasmatota archaeon]|nr:GTPase [Candidatus Thermoplasmatota archaeon]